LKGKEDGKENVYSKDLLKPRKVEGLLDSTAIPALVINADPLSRGFLSPERYIEDPLQPLAPNIGRTDDALSHITNLESHKYFMDKKVEDDVADFCSTLFGEEALSDAGIFLPGENDISAVEISEVFSAESDLNGLEKTAAMRVPLQQQRGKQWQMMMKMKEKQQQMKHGDGSPRDKKTSPQKIQEFQELKRRQRPYVKEKPEYLLNWLIPPCFGSGKKILRQIQSHQNGLCYKDWNKPDSLFNAAMVGHIFLVNSFIEQQRSLEYKGIKGQTALLVASKNGHIDCVRALLRAGALVDVRDWDGRTALILAICNNHESIVLQLIAAGANLDIRDWDGKTAVIWAASHGNVNIVSALIKDHVDLDIRYKVNGTALISAAKHGKTEVVRILLEAGAPLNCKDWGGRTALMQAVLAGHLQIVNLLVHAGAELNITGERGRTALMLAEETNVQSMIIETLRNATMTKQF